MNRNSSTTPLYLIVLLLILGGLFILPVFAGGPAGRGPGNPTSGELPPRATLVPTPTPSANSVAPVAAVGGQIQLQTEFSEGWPWESTPWYQLWTVVEWYDHNGNAYLVDGWQGQLDAVEQQTLWTGRKSWWVSGSELGAGPFRWKVYDQPGGRLIGMSEPFYLPNGNGETMTVKVSLTP